MRKILGQIIKLCDRVVFVTQQQYKKQHDTCEDKDEMKKLNETAATRKTCGKGERKQHLRKRQQEKQLQNNNKGIANTQNISVGKV